MSPPQDALAIDAHSPSWPVIARWLTGLLGTILIAVCGFLVHQVVVVNSTVDARQDTALTEQRAALAAMRDYEISSLKYELRRVADSIDKLNDRLRQQEMKP